MSNYTMKYWDITFTYIPASPFRITCRLFSRMQVVGAIKIGIRRSIKEKFRVRWCYRLDPCRFFCTLCVDCKFRCPVARMKNDFSIPDKIHCKPFEFIFYFILVQKKILYVLDITELKKSDVVTGMNRTINYRLNFLNRFLFFIPAMKLYRICFLQEMRD